MGQLNNAVEVLMARFSEWEKAWIEVSQVGDLKRVPILLVGDAIDRDSDHVCLL